MQSISLPDSYTLPSASRIIDNGRFVVLNIIRRNAYTTIHLLYDIKYSTPATPVYFAASEMTKDRFVFGKEPHKGCDVPRLIEEDDINYLLLDWIPSVKCPGLSIPIDDQLTLLTQVGIGAFGTIFLAHDHCNNTDASSLVAVKMLKDASGQDRLRLFQERELELHQRVSGHPNVVTLRRTVMHGGIIFVIMDYLPDSDLYYHLVPYTTYLMKNDLIKSVFSQLVDAVKYLHDNGVYHRDLKPENILTSHEGSRVYLADFGLATDVAYTDEYGCGSHNYLSPESIRGPRKWHDSLSSAAGDKWALAIILVNLVVGSRPWDLACYTNTDFGMFLRQPGYLRELIPISEEFCAVLEKMFAKSPADRYTLDDMKAAVDGVTEFVMSEEDLKLANGRVREVAVDINLLMYGSYSDCREKEILEVTNPDSFSQLSSSPTLSSNASSGLTLAGPYTPEMIAVDDAALVSGSHDTDVPDIEQAMGGLDVDSETPAVGGKDAPEMGVFRVFTAPSVL